MVLDFELLVFSCCKTSAISCTESVNLNSHNNMYMYKYSELVRPLMPLSRYLLMTTCWKYRGDSRPSFAHLVNSLSSLLETMADYLDIFTISNLGAEDVIAPPPVSNPGAVDQEDVVTPPPISNPGAVDQEDVVTPPPVSNPGAVDQEDVVTPPPVSNPGAVDQEDVITPLPVSNPGAVDQEDVITPLPVSNPGAVDQEALSLPTVMDKKSTPPHASNPGAVDKEGITPEDQPLLDNPTVVEDTSTPPRLHTIIEDTFTPLSLHHLSTMEDDTTTLPNQQQELEHDESL